MGGTFGGTGWSSTMAENTIRHQLDVWIDWCGENVIVSYGYRDSGVQIPQRQHRLSITAIPRDDASALEAIACATLERFVPSAPRRIPHGRLIPTYVPGCLTVVLQDQRRQGDLPLARMYLNEDYPATGRRTEHSLRLEAADFEPPLYRAWERLRRWGKAQAWSHYVTNFGPYVEWRS